MVVKENLEQLAIPQERRIMHEDVQKALESIHRTTIRTPMHKLVDQLQELLTRQLTAAIAGVKDAKTVSRWSKQGVTDPRLESERRLRAAFEIALILSQFESSDIVRPWFIGANPHLKGRSPAEVISEGNTSEVREAAFAFVTL